MQTSPRTSISNQQSIAYGENSAYQLQSGRDHSEYIEKDIEEIILSDEHRKHRSSISDSNE